MQGSPAKGTALTKWGERERESFEALKKAVTSKPVLRHPQIGKRFIIDPDSSQYTIGAVLLQEFPDSKTGKMRLHPIAFESKKLTETESRYSTQERELLTAKYLLDHGATSSRDPHPHPHRSSESGNLSHEENSHSQTGAIYAGYRTLQSSLYVPTWPAPNCP